MGHLYGCVLQEKKFTSGNVNFRSDAAKYRSLDTAPKMLH